jgi:hypothetical protein
MGRLREMRRHCHILRRNMGRQLRARRPRRKMMIILI